MNDIFTWLAGKKTYIVAILAFVFNVGAIQGWWPLDDKLWAEINTLLGTFGLAFLRMGVTKSGPAS